MKYIKCLCEGNFVVNDENSFTHDVMYTDAGNMQIGLVGNEMAIYCEDIVYNDRIVINYCPICGKQLADFQVTPNYDTYEC